MTWYRAARAEARAPINVAERARRATGPITISQRGDTKCAYEDRARSRIVRNFSGGRRAAHDHEIWRPISFTLLRIAFGLLLMTHGVPKLLGAGHGAQANPLASATKAWSKGWAA